jgi:hypothetical protein
MGFLTVIFFIVAGFYLLGRLFRWWVGRRIREFQRQMGGDPGAQGRPRQTSRRQPREGEIKVETGSAPGKKVNDSIGDYVEFEEVEITETTEEKQ